jgi:hypothetical protein
MTASRRATQNASADCMLSASELADTVQKPWQRRLRWYLRCIIEHICAGSYFLVFFPFRLSFMIMIPVYVFITMFSSIAEHFCLSRIGQFPNHVTGLIKNYEGHMRLADRRLPTPGTEHNLSSSFSVSN